MDWGTAKTMQWKTLILIAGGFALSAGVEASGLSNIIASAFAPIQHLPCSIMLLCTISLIALITDWLLSSNVAVAALVLPVLAGIADLLDIDRLTLLVPATIACSLSFCSPVSTPPNAIAYSTGVLTVAEMVQAGICVAACSVVLTWLFSLTLGQLVFGYSSCW